MKIELNWRFEPIELGNSGTLRANIKNFDLKDYLEIAGFIFFIKNMVLLKMLFMLEKQRIFARG